MNAIVVTTIYEPTKAILRLVKNSGVQLVVIGDTKTPIDWKVEGSVFLGLEAQNRIYGKLSKAMPTKSYARKNLGYLHAFKNGAEMLFETDDDNYLYKYAQPFPLESTITTNTVSCEKCLNIYKLFTKKKIYPRGYPLELVKQGMPVHFSIKPIHKKYKVIYTLANGNTDVDAISRLIINGDAPVSFDKNKQYGIEKGTFVPFNSQGTYWHKTLLPIMYLPFTVSGRVADIWRGYISQRIMWELNENILVKSPILYQERNAHNLIKDFADEIDLYCKGTQMLENLRELHLKGSIEDMLISTYEALVNKKLFKPQELNIVEAWLKEVNKVAK